MAISFQVGFSAIATETQGTTYYTDSVGGNDNNSGTTEQSAWQSLTKVNATTFNPGGKLLLKAGCVWNGLLWPKGSGYATGGAIVIDT